MKPLIEAFVYDLATIDTDGIFPQKRKKRDNEYTSSSSSSSPSSSSSSSFFRLTPEQESLGIPAPFIILAGILINELTASAPSSTSLSSLSKSSLPYLQEEYVRLQQAYYRQVSNFNNKNENGQDDNDRFNRNEEELSGEGENNNNNNKNDNNTRIFHLSPRMIPNQQQQDWIVEALNAKSKQLEKKASNALEELLSTLPNDDKDTVNKGKKKLQQKKTYTSNKNNKNNNTDTKHTKKNRPNQTIDQRKEIDEEPSLETKETYPSTTETLQDLLAINLNNRQSSNDARTGTRTAPTRVSNENADRGEHDCHDDDDEEDRSTWVEVSKRKVMKPLNTSKKNNGEGDRSSKILSLKRTTATSNSDENDTVPSLTESGTLGLSASSSSEMPSSNQRENQKEVISPSSTKNVVPYLLAAIQVPSMASSPSPSLSEESSVPKISLQTKTSTSSSKKNNDEVIGKSTSDSNLPSTSAKILGLKNFDLIDDEKAAADLFSFGGSRTTRVDTEATTGATTAKTMIPSERTDDSKVIMLNYIRRSNELEFLLAKKEQQLQDERSAHQKAMRQEKERCDDLVQSLQLRLYISETRLKTYQDALEEHVESVANNISSSSSSSSTNADNHHRSGGIVTVSNSQNGNTTPTASAATRTASASASSAKPPSSPLISRVLQQQNRLLSDD